MKKLSKIIINGVSTNIKDSSALELPEEVEIQNGDVLVYSEDEGCFIYVNKDALVEVENGIKRNSEKLAKSGDVYTAIYSAINPNNDCYLDITYDPNTSKIHIDPSQDCEVLTDLKLLVISLNTSYSQQVEELNFQNTIKVISLNPLQSSAELYVSPYNQDRVFNFLLVNNDCVEQKCFLNSDSILIPGVNEKTNVVITASLGSIAGRQTIIVTSSINVNVDIDVNLTFVGENSTTTTETITLLSGSSSQTKEIGMSGNARICYLAITPSSIDELQNYVLQTLELAIPAGLTKVQIIAEADDQYPQINFNTVGNIPVTSDIDVKIILPRSGVVPITLSGKILTGYSSTGISYSGQGFSGNIVGVALGTNKVDSMNEYYMLQPQVEIIVNS